MEAVALVAALAWIVLGTAKMKWHPFVVLLLAAFGLALALGQSAGEAVGLINEGFGGTMGRIGLIILLGAMLGEVLEKSGATETIAHGVVRRLHRLPTTYAMSLIGYVVAIPVFCDAAFILLSPLTKSMARNAKVSGKALTVALSTGLFAPHVLIPPTPGPLAAAATLELEDLGVLILAGGVMGFLLVLAGGWFATRMAKSLKAEAVVEELAGAVQGGSMWRAMLPLLLPLVLIAGGTSLRGLEGAAGLWISALSRPESALAIGVVSALGLAERKLQGGQWVRNAIGSGGPVLMITAMGGALGLVLKQIDVGSWLEGLAMPGALALVLPFVVAAVLKSAQGSSTVAIITTASMMVPMLAGLGLDSDLGKVWVILSLGAGAMTVSHANDSYFWIVSEMGGLSTEEAFKYHTRATALQGLLGLVLVVLSGWLVL
jgi:GntP family gluconate:H+ symporter